MKKHTFAFKNAADIIILSVLLLIGLIVGAVAASYIDENTASELVLSISSSGLNNISANLLQIFLSIFKYPFFVFLLSFTFLGIIFTPLVLALKGYLVSFSIGTLVKLYGLPGLGLAGAVFGIQTLISIPCLFLLSLKSFEISKEQCKFLSGKKISFSDVFFAKHYLFTLCICIFALVFLVLIEYFIVPHIVKYTFNFLA